MANTRVPDGPSALRRRVTAPGMPAPAPGPVPTARDLLLHSWAGRLFISSTAVKVLVGLLRLAVDLPLFLRIVSGVATLGLVVSVLDFGWMLFLAAKRQLLWRVRRRLILSYIFFGVIPAFLIVGFFLLGAFILAMSVSAYVFRNGYDKIVDDVKLAAQSAALETARHPDGAADTMQRLEQSARQRYPGISMAFIPADSSRLAPVRVGRWDHGSPPAVIPAWLRAQGQEFAGTLVTAQPGAPGEIELVARAVVPVRADSGVVGDVVADLPLDAEMMNLLEDKTSIRVGTITEVTEDTPQPTPFVPQTTGSLTLFRNSVTVLDGVDWLTGVDRRASVALMYRPADLDDRLGKAQNSTLRGYPLNDLWVVLLVFVAVLFLIIQGVALVMGLALARSITRSIHELFMGTERVRHGDFTHRIDIPTRDQLGELAQSFNQMTGSIEGLLQTAAEKKRLEEELRIARHIQMSLLPRGPLGVPGLAITALCVPAREVGGDYYDFFPLSNDRLGVLIADVSGKGTSAALYMAELKGVVLSLSQRYQSPRELLIEVNRIISENLDSRSFITVTYAVIDTRRG